MTQKVDGETLGQIMFDAIAKLITTIEDTATALDPHERRITNFGPISDVADEVFDAITDRMEWYDDGETDAHTMRSYMNNNFRDLRIAAYGKSRWDRAREQAAAKAKEGQP